jgi:hypothetical protein
MKTPITLLRTHPPIEFGTNGDNAFYLYQKNGSRGNTIVFSHLVMDAFVRMFQCQIASLPPPPPATPEEVLATIKQLLTPY